MLGLFDILTAESITFEDDTKNIRKLITRVSRDRCFDPAIWKEFRFFAFVDPDNDILPVRTVYDGVTQNIGNKTPRAFFAQFASCHTVSKLV